MSFRPPRRSSCILDRSPLASAIGSSQRFFSSNLSSSEISLAAFRSPSIFSLSIASFLNLEFSSSNSGMCCCARFFATSRASLFASLCASKPSHLSSRSISSFSCFLKSSSFSLSHLLFSSFSFKTFLISDCSCSCCLPFSFFNLSTCFVQFSLYLSLTTFMLSFSSPYLLLPSALFSS